MGRQAIPVSFMGDQRSLWFLNNVYCLCNDNSGEASFEDGHVVSFEENG